MDSLDFGVSSVDKFHGGYCILYHVPKIGEHVSYAIVVFLNPCVLRYKRRLALCDLHCAEGGHAAVSAVGALQLDRGQVASVLWPFWAQD